MSDETLPEADGLRIHWVYMDAQAISLRAGDVLVLMHPGVLPDNVARNLRDSLADRFPGHKAIVLEEGMRLGVLRPENTEELC